jgi:D-serine deaminase-like pyridoxal phosphate-dependent protein
MPRVVDLSTPALVVDAPVFEANLAAAERLVAGTGKTIRPHVKTHRSPALALRQLRRAGAVGVTCATVGEAEAMADAGIDDLLVANEVVSAEKLARLAALATRARVAVAVDAAEPALALAAAATRAGAVVDVLVDLDVGLGRCGVASVEAALDLAARCAGAAGLRFAGLMGYEGRARATEPDRGTRIAAAQRTLAAARARIEAAGLEVRTVSASGTSTLREALRDPTVTEIQAGTYALMEADIDGLGLPFRPALGVVATVISRTGGRAVVDAGRKSISCEYGPPTAPGGAVVRAINEEHTVLAWPGAAPALGARVRLAPSHVRLTFNLHNVAWLVDGDDVVERFAVAARGRSA